MNRLAGATITLPDQNALLSIRPDQLWSVREAAGRASFTRIDLATVRLVTDGISPALGFSGRPVSRSISPRLD